MPRENMANIIVMEVAIGFEPTHRGVADLCLTAWLRHHFRKAYGLILAIFGNNDMRNNNFIISSL